MQGQPVFRGTRVPVKTLFDYLEGGESLEDFLEGFPTVARACNRSAEGWDTGVGPNYTQLRYLRRRRRIGRLC
jgi:hypothetical protein